MILISKIIYFVVNNRKQKVNKLNLQHYISIEIISHFCCYNYNNKYAKSS